MLVRQYNQELLFPTESEANCKLIIPFLVEKLSIFTQQEKLKSLVIQYTLSTFEKLT